MFKKYLRTASKYSYYNRVYGIIQYFACICEHKYKTI